MFAAAYSQVTIDSCSLGYVSLLVSICTECCMPVFYLFVQNTVFPNNFSTLCLNWVPILQTFQPLLFCSSLRYKAINDNGYIAAPG